MATVTARRPIPFQELSPLDDEPLAAAEPIGPSPAELASFMADYLLASAPGSDAEALAILRRAFPRAPLTVRVAALATLMRR